MTATAARTSRRAITLSTFDLAYGIDLGKHRFLNATTHHLSNKLTPGRDPVACHVDGALAEVAVARVLGLPLPAGLHQYHRDPDLPPDIEVRWTSRDDGDLIVRDDDDLDRLFVAVTGYAPTFTLVGSIRGYAAAIDEWRRDPGGYGAAWFVPQHALIPGRAP